MKGRNSVIAKRIELLSSGSNALLWEYNNDNDTFTEIEGPIKQLLDIQPEECVSVFESSSEVIDFVKLLADESRQEKVLRLDLTVNETRWLRFSGHRRNRSDGTTIVHGAAFDVTELEESRQQLTERTRQDPLTGLANREGLN